MLPSINNTIDNTTDIHIVQNQMNNS